MTNDVRSMTNDVRSMTNDVRSMTNDVRSMTDNNKGPEYTNDDERLQLSIDMWTWLMENPGKVKSDWPRYYEEQIEQYMSYCTVCHERRCCDCPLFGYIGSSDTHFSYGNERYSGCAKGAFSAWANASAFPTDKKAAYYAARSILRQLQKGYPV